MFNKKENSKKSSKENDLYVKDFMDMIVPSIIKFFPSHYRFGNTFRQVIAIKNYPLDCKSVALLKKFGERKNITLKVISEKMNVNEYERLLENNINKSLAETQENNNVGKVKANVKLEKTQKLIEHITSKPDLSIWEVSVYIEIIAGSMEELKSMKVDILSKLDNISYDDMYLRQKEGFLAVNPASGNKVEEFTRHMDSEALANLFPFSYSGKIDTNGFPLGTDKFGGNIIIDFDKRDNSRTNSNILILGNAGEGKSYTVKKIIVDWRLKGQNIICLDPESEYKDLTENLDGYYIDLMEGKYIINVLEIRKFMEIDDEEDSDFDDSFDKTNLLSQHLSFLRDFFKAYKDVNDSILDCIEIFLTRTYKKFGITHETDISKLCAREFPTLKNLYEEIENANVNDEENSLFTAELLQELKLSLNSICVGSDSRYFSGHTNISSYEFLTFGVKGLLESSKNLRNAMLFNVLTYMTNKLLVEGNTTAILDEFYLFLDNMIMVKYVRNFAKRVRKKDSAIVIASQNIEDYLIKDIAEYTKPLFAIPTYKFLFYPGSIDREIYCSLLNLNQSEFNLIKSSSRGNCLFIAGNEKFNLQVKVSKKKSELFGKLGGR
ncbi:MAG: VirB4 family type IV secretion system protein [Sarcina sp.]